MRKKFVAVALAGISALAILTACEVKPGPAKFDFDRTQIDSVVIEDSVKGYYEDDLRIELDTSELSRFMSMVPELELRDGQAGQGSGEGGAYNIVCRNEGGVEQYTFTVDSSHNLNMEDKHLWHSEGLDKLFDELEDKYGLTTIENMKRKPGAEYFSLTDDIAKINFAEYTETNFDEGADYTLTAKEVEELKNGISQATFLSEQGPKKEDYLSRIYTVDKWGSISYSITVISDHEVNINGRAVDYDSVKDWLLKIEEVSGYVRD